MAIFHRLATPTYFGGLPASFDYLNTPSDPSVGGSGVPALVDGKRTGGTNDGTYFVAFTEDGLSKAVNRGLSALALNTDFLDNVLRTSIPKVITTDLTAVGAVTTVALTGEIFVGEFGLANNGTNRALLVHVTEQATNDDLEVGGTKITPLLIHDGAAANVVGTIASGFRTNASVNFSPAIPNGTAYRVWYGIRSSLAEISATEKGAYFKYLIRNVEHMPGSARSLFRQLHSEAAINQAYTDPWDSTIRSLASAGLNERYRRSTTQPAGFVTGDYNVAGGGAIILRDGQAVTIKTKDINLSSALYPDASLAGLKVIPEANRVSTGSSTYDVTKGGDIGYWHESDFKNFPAADFTNEVVRRGPAGPALIDVLPRDFRSGTLATHTAITFINDQANASLNPASGGGATARKTVQCAAGQYFGFTGSSESAIRLKTDLLEIRYQSGPKAGTTELYVVNTVEAANQVTVRQLNGIDADFGAVAITDVRIRWIQTLVSIGNGGGRDASEGLGNRNRSFFCATPSYITTSAASEQAGAPAFFGAAREVLVDGSWLDVALEWGGFSGSTGNFFRHGLLYGDGSISTTKLTSSGSIIGLGGTLNTLSLLTPDYHVFIDEDWIRATQSFSPNLIQSHNNVWLFNEIAGTFTLNNGTPSAKNPGQLQFIGAGGNTSKILTVYATSQFPFAFANLELMTITANVTVGASNPAPKLVIGLFDSTTAFGNDNLSLGFQPSLGWFVKHIVSGAGGAHNNAVLGAQVDATFVVVRFVRQANGDIAITFNGSLITTVTVAQLPTGNCTLVIYCEQTTLEPNGTTFVIDKCYARFFSAVDRSGL